MTIVATRRVPTTAIVPVERDGAIRPGDYVGLVTRVLAFAVDAIVINVIALAVAAVVALFFSVVSIPADVRKLAVAVSGGLYLLWTVAYFTAFWSTTGQTPGDRLLRIRVMGYNGERLKPRRALLRFLALTVAALPLFAGFLWILIDDRRRGWHDLIARTVVVETGAPDAARPPQITP